MAVRAVIFDLGRVLVDVVITDEFRRRLGWQDAWSSTPGPRRGVFERLYVDFSTGRIDAREFHRRLSRRAEVDIGYQELIELWCSLLRPLDGAKRLFERVAERLPVGLLSDTDPVHWQFVLEHYPFLRRIEKPTLSFQTGYLKPDPRAYQAALNNCRFPAADCLFIDDKPQNAAGAAAAGMQAIVFEGVEKLEAQLSALEVL